MVDLAQLEIRASYHQDEIYGFLARDRLQAAYAIAYLESPLWELSRFHLAYRGAEPVAAAVIFTPGQFSTLFTMGDAAAVQAIFAELRELPDTIWFAAERRHLPPLRRFYHLDTCAKMRRMAVAAETFRPASGPAVRLAEEDFPELEQTYRLAQPSPFLRDMFLRGVYYGIRRQGRLVSVAGTHFISRDYSLGAVGNVVTLEEERKQGYATLCTSAVTEELLKTCRDVVLNVREDNRPARRVYAKLGYRPHSFYWEGRGWSRFG